MSDFENLENLYVVFKLRGNYYCISSEYVQNMLKKTNIDKVLQSKEYDIGNIVINNVIVPVIDARILFGMIRIEDEIKNFSEMKNKHLDWVAKLRESVKDNTEFTLSKDYHNCSFGKWYYNYSTDNISLNFVLNKIENPHKLLHNYADIIEKLKVENKKDEIKKVLNDADKLCNNTIVPLLDELISIYEHINKGIIIVIEKYKNYAGLLVDEVISIKTIEDKKNINKFENIQKNEYIKNVIVDSNGKIIYEVDAKKLLNIS